MKRTSTAEEKRHMAKVAALGCVVCDHCHGYPDSPAEIHHVRFNHGWGRSSHLMTIGLCTEHHRGKTGVHSMGRAEFEEMHGYSEIDLLDVVTQKLGLFAQTEPSNQPLTGVVHD